MEQGRPIQMPFEEGKARGLFLVPFAQKNDGSKKMTYCTVAYSLKSHFAK